MTEFEEKDGKLVEIKPPCEHEWGIWHDYPHLGRKERFCKKHCGEYQIMVPHGNVHDYIDRRLAEIDADRIIVARIFGMLLGLGIFGCIKYLFF